MSSLAAERQSRLTQAAGQVTGGGNIAVNLRGVTKTFGEVHALNNATLSVRQGELMTLLGPSGCGKSTLLNLIAGFLNPDRGELEIDGHRVNDTPPYKREIGMVFQNYALFPHMSAAANVGYGLRMRRLAKHQVARRVADALALVRLSGIEERRPHQLSGGQQQRVALARALVISPKVLLLDEPLSALDRSLRASMQVEIKEIQRQLGVTTLFVTHDQSEALSLSDRIAVMFDGQIRQIGSPAEIYRRPSDRFVASFVGDVNVLRARLGSIVQASATISLGAQSIPVATGPLAASKPGDPVDLFVRPEQLRLSGTGEPVAAQGTVTTHIYQGGHVDLLVLSPVASGGRLLVRSSEPDAMTRWPVGAVVGVSVSGADAQAFPPQDDKP
ncbi:MAG: ABC transporter ATP-binding protein [Hyphomicrobiaceae bacterium]|nr:ABC transporter ATP-binding protein [Hyphomicrobiaceae bacterium]